MRSRPLHPALRAARLAGCALFLAAPAAAQVPWASSWDEAFQRARDENVPVFLAVNMDGERANDALAEKAYRDADVVAWASRMVPLVASADAHGTGDSCRRFPGIPCSVHQEVEMAAREKGVLPVGSDGRTVAPQHVWLAPDGSVLLSVAYALDKDELLWCMAEALKQVRGDDAPPAPKGAKKPRRLVVGGVAGAAARLRPLTEDELEEALDRYHKTRDFRERLEILASLVATDHPDAIEAVQDAMQSSTLGGGGRGIRGEARRSARAGGRIAELRRRVVHRIGVFSPSSWWVVPAELLGDDDPELRLEAAVALEQLAEPKSGKAVRLALGKEKDPRVERALVRAMATTGDGGSKTRKKLVQLAKGKDVGLRLQALFGLGGYADAKDAQTLLREALTGPDPLERDAAALGIAFFGAEALEPDLAAAAELPALDPDAKDRLARTLAVLRGEADRNTLGDDVQAVLGDEIRRERFFGRPADADDRPRRGNDDGPPPDGDTGTVGG